MNEKTDLKNVLIVGSITFPNGMADTARVTALARALSLRKVAVTLLVPRINGKLENKYPFRIVAVRSRSSKIVKRTSFGLAVSRLQLLACFLKLALKNRYNTVYFYGPNTDNIILALLVRCISRARIVVEYTDAINRKWRTATEFLQGVSFRSFPRVADVVLVISIRLERYFRIYYKINTIRMNAFSSRDMRRMSAREADNMVVRQGLPVITYSGSLLPSEGVGDLVEAVLQINKVRSQVKLNVAGFSLSEESRSIAQRLVKESTRTDISYLGFLDEFELGGVLLNSDILVIAKRNVRINRYGFSTKLPEYLSLGKVVVCSDIGEVHRFVKNCTDVVLFNPDLEGDLIRALFAAIELTRANRCANHFEHLSVFEPDFNVSPVIASL